MKRGKKQQDATIRCLLLCFCSTPTETFIVITSHNAAPHNRYQPHPAEPEQYNKCSNRAFILLKMGIMMPETC